MHAGRKKLFGIQSGARARPERNARARASIQGECGLNRAPLERGRFAAFQFLVRSKKKIQSNESRQAIWNQILSSRGTGQRACSDRGRGKGHQGGGARFNTKAPQTPFRVTGRPFEQPSPEVCSISTYSTCLSSGMALPCNMTARQCYSLEGLLASSPSPAKHDDRSCRARYR